MFSSNPCVDRLPLATSARMIKLGIYAGIGYGLSQDALALIHGQHVSYVDKLRDVFGRQEEHNAALT